MTAAEDTCAEDTRLLPHWLRPLRQALDRSRDRPVVAPAGRAGGSAAQTPNLSFPRGALISRSADSAVTAIKTDPMSL